MGARGRMSPSTAATAKPLSVAIDPYRGRLAEDAGDFTIALLALAKANAKRGGTFNAPSPEDAVALHALAHWRRDARHALARVKALAHDTPGRPLAEKWLKALIAALDLQRSALSLVDPTQAAEAGRQAHVRIAESHRLEESLNRVLA
jgi:hypothetical protein